MVLRHTRRYSYHNGEPRKFWGCSTYPRCSATHGAHPDGTPLGVPADAVTKRARQRAHAAFDPLWQTGMFSREDAYHELARLLDIPREEAHFGRFDRERCEQVVRMIGELYGQPQEKDQPAYAC